MQLKIAGNPNLGCFENFKNTNNMYNILASVFSKKTMNTYLTLEIRVACRELLTFKYVVFFETKPMINYICTLEILKLAFKTGFSVQNIRLYLCLQVLDTK